MGSPELGISRGLIKKLRAYFVQQPGNSGARVYASQGLTHNNTGNYFTLTFDSEREDTGWITDDGGTTRGYWRDDGNANWQQKLFAQKAGWHMIVGNVAIEADATGRRILDIYLNGTTTIAQQEWNPSNNVEGRIEVSTSWWMEAGDYVTLRLYQNSGGNLAIYSLSSYSPEFAINRIP